MKKQIELTLEQAKELLETTPSLKDVIYSNFPELSVIKSWADLSKLNGISGYHIDTRSNIVPIYDVWAVTENKNLFATKKQARSALAYAQLTQLMQATGDCDVDWEDHTSLKHCIVRNANIITFGIYFREFHPLAFKTKEIRDLFQIKHNKLIKEYFEL